MSFKYILLDKKDHIATITLNRPHALNALTLDMFDEVKAALKDVNDDKDVRVVILTGAGRGFCTAVDIKDSEGQVGKRLLSSKSIWELRQFATKRPQGITRGIRSMEKPIIAMINGLAVADGVDWCLACDIRIGCENTRFLNGFVNMALFPVTGGAWLYPRVMGLGKAFEFMYTGRWIEADEALEIGMIDKLVPSEKLIEETMAIARKIAQGPPAALRLMRMQTYLGQNIGLDAALELAADGEVIMTTTEDHLEALSAWMEKREAKFIGR
jgi:enoyl-CoA hydratase/carnithine racemase